MTKIPWFSPLEELPKVEDLKGNKKSGKKERDFFTFHDSVKPAGYVHSGVLPNLSETTKNGTVKPP